MTPDTLMSLSVNAAVCPITEERERGGQRPDGRGPRHPRTGRPWRERQSPGRADAWGQPQRREAGPEEQLGAWRSPEKGEVTASPGPSRAGCPQGPSAPPGPQPKAESRHARAGGPDPPTSHLPSRQRRTYPDPRPWRPPTRLSARRAPPPAMEPRTREANNHGNPGHSRRQVSLPAATARGRPGNDGTPEGSSTRRGAQHSRRGRPRALARRRRRWAGLAGTRPSPRPPCPAPRLGAASLLVGPHLEHPLGHAGLTP